MSQEEDSPDEGQKVWGSGEYGRLYVGNLPYSMTSSQLAEVFGEAGRVVNVEVCSVGSLFMIVLSSFGQKSKL